MDTKDRIDALHKAFEENEKSYRLILGGSLAPIALLGSKFDVLTGLGTLQASLLTGALVCLLLAAVLSVSAVGRTHTCRRNLLHSLGEPQALLQLKADEETAEAISGWGLLFVGLGYAALSSLFIVRIWTT